MARVIFWDVDTQYDFMHPDGKLYVPEAERIIGNLQPPRHPHRGQRRRSRDEPS
jgi:nicotinamidase-related amidase